MTGPGSATSHEVASVLVVDDAPEVAALLEPLLRARGFLVSIAADGCSALEIIHRETPDVVILDIGLPDIDGFDVCQQAVDAGVPLVLLLSARSDEADRIRGFAAGAADYVVKPFSPREVGLRVDGLLRRATSTLDRTALQSQRDAIASEYERAREVKRQFLTNVSHEVRTPLTSIIGFADTLQSTRGQLDADTVDEIITHLVREATRLDRIVTGAIDLRSPSTDGPAFEREQVDIAALVEATITEMEADTQIASRACVRENNMELQAHVAPLLVRDAVRHLIDNSLRHAPGACERTVTIASDDDYVHIRVEDSGPGVPDAAKLRIFEPLEQRRLHTSAHAPGLGMGLAIVQRVAELHGGRTWVEDRSGGGSIFVLSLPRTDGD